MSSEAEEVIIHGQSLRCYHCGTVTFFKRTVVMPAPGASTLGLSALSPHATCYVCSECTFVHWFAADRR
ncbi:MAG: hypothetical protein ABIT20_00800 [Gemmatimonadaceae bacterium]